jgi:hypothetical protein
MSPILQLLENLIGVPHKGSGSNFKFSCPFPACEGRPSKLAGDKKLEVDIETTDIDGKPVNKWACWSCKTRGKSIYTLLKAINAPEHAYTELADILKYTDNQTGHGKEKVYFHGMLPREYKPLAGKLPRNELKLRHAKAYVKSRGFTENDILKYSIGFCEDGEYSGRVIIPSYDAQGKVNYLIARTIHEDVKPKYKNPPYSRDIIPFELFINWDEPIVLCEGGFDLVSIKRNVIPLLDKELQPELLKKLLGGKCKKVYLAIDPDAAKQFIKYAELLINEGIQVFMLDFAKYQAESGEKVDPNEMGFEVFTSLIQKAGRITSGKLMKMKINRS